MALGSLIMQRLEDVIAREYESVRLEATLPAVIMFEKRGYVQFAMKSGL